MGMILVLDYTWLHPGSTGLCETKSSSVLAVYDLQDFHQKKTMRILFLSVKGMTG